jgi:hypothetical protein
MSRLTWALALSACVSEAPVLMRPLDLPGVRTTARGEIVLRCQPEDADVLLDGVPQGICGDFDGTSGALGLGDRERRVEVRKSGFSAWEGQLVADGTRMIVHVTLTRMEGSTP